MSQKPPTRAMRANPDIEQLKRQAKELLDAYRASSSDAIAEVTWYRRTASPDTFALHDAQFVLARSYGFESWPKLKAAVDGVTANKLHEAAEAGDLQTARELLTRRPEIVDLGRGEMRALHMAVLRRDLAMTNLLLGFRADPHAGIWPNRDATGPLTIARDRGYDEIVEAIRTAMGDRGIQHPDLVPANRADGITNLHLAAGRGMPDVIQRLLDDGADINEMVRAASDHAATFLTGSRVGWTPIDFAATGRGGARTAEFLLARGAHLTPLSAASLGRWDFLEKLPKHDLEFRGVLEAAVHGNQPDTLRHLLALGLNPDEPIQIGHMEEQTWSSGGPLFQAVVLKRMDLARLLLARGADPNANVFTAGSAAYRAYEHNDPGMIALIEKHGGWLDPASAGYARQTEIARKMLAGEIDPHFAPSYVYGGSVAEQLLWGGASSLCDDIVRMALERIDWPPEDPRWFRMLCRPMHNHADRPECCDTFKLILARSGPHHRASEYGYTILHEVVSGDSGFGVQLATMLLDAGARLDTREDLLKSTPLGWASRWGRIELVKLFLSRGADPVEADAEPWSTPRAWAEKMQRPEIAALLDAARK